MRLPRNPARAARRKTEQRESFGSEPPVCIYCGITEPSVITLTRISRRRVILESNQTYGRNHDSEATFLLCRNCHALFHENLLDAGVDLRPEADPTKRVVTMLRAEAVHFEMLADAKWRQAVLLEGKER
jgi:hypothetical protein